MRELPRGTLSWGIAVAAIVVAAVSSRGIGASSAWELGAYESWQWCDPLDEQ